MFATLFGISLILHGLVHLLYSGQSLRKFELSAGFDWPDRSWYFGRLLGAQNTRKLIAVGLVVAALGFATAGSGLLLGAGWWQSAAVGTAVWSALVFLAGWDGTFKQLDNQGGFGVLINMGIIFLLEVLGWPG